MKGNLKMFVYLIPLGLCLVLYGFYKAQTNSDKANEAVCLPLKDDPRIFILLGSGLIVCCAIISVVFYPSF